MDERLVLIVFPLSFFLLLIGKKETEYLKYRISSSLKRIMNLILENNIEELLSKTKFSVSIDLFQTIRIITVLMCAFMITAITRKVSFNLLIIGILIYKAFYAYLNYLYYEYRSQIKQQLPYFLKCIVYLCYIYPVPNALNKAVELVPEIFKDQLVGMNRLIDANPNSFIPYEWLNDQLHYPSPNFVMYLRIIYRMAQSGGSEHQDLLANINQNVSDELNIIRKRKNKKINDTIQYLGLIPVIMVTIMLGYLLIKVSEVI